MSLKYETKSVKHPFTPPELSELNKEFRGAVKQVNVIETELNQIKATYKAKTAEQEAAVSRLDSLLDAGFEMRNVKCVVVYRPKEQEKDYYLETQADEKAEGGLAKDSVPVLTEPMTESDLQMELMQAEAKFDLRDEIQLFTPTEKDIGILIVGRQGGKWFGAIRALVGQRRVEERLDSEQPSFKRRADCVRKATGRFHAWLVGAMGKDTADGFLAALDSVNLAHKDREE